MRHRIMLGTIATVVAACTSRIPPTAPDAMLVEQGTVSAPGTGVTGRMVGAGGHDAKGAVTFSVKDGVGRLDFSADFTITPGPGPFVYVNTTNNANTGKPLRVAALRSNTGAQSYSFQLPAGVSYTWVLVWCDPFNVALGEASIPATP